MRSALLRSRQSELGLRQRGLAELAFCHDQWIVKLESGHDNAELVRVLAVVHALGLTLDLREREKERPGELDLAVGGPG